MLDVSVDGVERHDNYVTVHKLFFTYQEEAEAAPEEGPEILEEIILDRVFFIQHWLNAAEVHVLNLELVRVPAACAGAALASSVYFRLI